MNNSSHTNHILALTIGLHINIPRKEQNSLYVWRWNYIIHFVIVHIILICNPILNESSKTTSSDLNRSTCAAMQVSSVSGVFVLYSLYRSHNYYMSYMHIFLTFFRQRSLPYRRSQSEPLGDFFGNTKSESYGNGRVVTIA